MIKLISILKEVMEGKPSTTNAAVKALLSKTDQLGGHSDPKRVKNISKLSAEEFKALLEDALGVEKESIEVIPPPNNESSKFSVFKFEYKNGIAQIVLAGEQRGEKVEAEQKTLLEQQIKSAIEENNGKPVKIKVGDVTYTVATGDVIKVPGNLMADFAVDDTIYIQHKQERFQQMSGFVMTLRDGKLPEVAKKEMQDFVQVVKSKVGSKMPPGTGYKQRVQDRELALAAIFGSMTEDFSVSKVQLVVQGEIQLVKLREGLYEIQGSSPEQTLAYADSIEIPEKWYPYMIARFSSGKSHNQFGIQNCRFNFATKNYYPGATVLTPSQDAKKVGR